MPARHARCINSHCTNSPSACGRGGLRLFLSQDGVGVLGRHKICPYVTPHTTTQIGIFMTSAVKFDKVTYTYGRNTPFFRIALDSVSLEVKSGAITGIIGHTGSGKSTLVQHINGLLEPEQGKVFVMDKDIWEDKKRLREVRYTAGLVFQYPEYQLFDETVKKDVAFGPKNMGLPEDEIDTRVKAAIRFVGLPETVLDKSPFELSGGQKRRVAIAGVIAMQPQILILDEPAAGLDPRGREEILGGIRAYQRESGTTVIIVSHSMEDMARYSDNVIVMEDAKVLLSGTVKEVFSQGEVLDSIGLAVPQITRLLKRLAHAGLPVRQDIFTVEEARQHLLEVLGEVENKSLTCI